MAAKFKVYVKHKGETTSLVVKPPFDSTSRTGKVKVDNKTDEKILVVLPDVFGISPFEVGARKDGDEVPITGNPAEGVYEFKVFSLTTLSAAVANSDPEIIIE